MTYEALTPQQLARKRQEMVKELNQLEQEIDQRRQQDRHLMRLEDLQWSKEGEVSPMLKKSQVARRRAIYVAPELGFNVHNFNLSCIEIAPGAMEGAYHMHGEAVKYYLEGKAIELVGDKRYEVKAGDAVFIPASTWHGSQNPGPGPLRFLAVTHSAMGVPLTVWPKIQIKE